MSTSTLPVSERHACALCSSKIDERGQCMGCGEDPHEALTREVEERERYRKLLNLERIEANKTRLSLEFEKKRAQILLRDNRSLREAAEDVAGILGKAYDSGGRIEGVTLSGLYLRLASN